MFLWQSMIATMSLRHEGEIIPMNKVIIEPKLLDINSNLLNGIITGFKKLVSRNIILQIDISQIAKDNILLKLFGKEGIEIKQKCDAVKNTFSITANNNSVIVNKKIKVKNIGEAIDYLLSNIRRDKFERVTKETKIKIEINLDGQGKYKINTGIGFFNHMLEQIARHSNCDLFINCKGDLFVDEHHTVEDVGITLGEAIMRALGDKKGIKRYGYFLPMDESIALCCIDLGGRPYLNFNCKFIREYVGKFPTELVVEFFRGLSLGLKANIYIKAKGDNEHHKIEAIFKAFAKALNEACRFDERNNYTLPTTKGIL